MHGKITCIEQLITNLITFCSYRERWRECALRSPATVTDVKWCQFTRSLIALIDERKVCLFICLSAHLRRGHFYIKKKQTILRYFNVCKIQTITITEELFNMSTYHENAVDADIAVIGLGSMGSFAFWQLASMGKSVIGFDRFRPGHDNGAGHGETRIFRTAYGEGVAYVPLLQAARELWRKLEAETSVELYVETGGTMFGPKDDNFITTVQESVQQYQLPHKVYEGPEAKKEYPQINFQDNQVAVFEELAGFVKPELAIETAVKRGEDLGGTVYTNSPVTRIDPDDDGVSIMCGDKQFRVKKVIVASGGWTSKLLPQLNLPVSLERQVLVWYKARNPELFTPDKFPIFSRVSKGRGFYGFPSLDGETVKVAFHHGGVTADHPDHIDREIHESDLLALTEKVKKYLPNLIPEPVKAKTCFYTNTPDEHFVLGPAPGLQHVTLLGPMAGHGFKFAPIMGEIAAELATDKTPSLDIKMFDPNRFQ